MKNRLTDLNDHLFMQIERLSETDLTSEQIEQEAARTDAIVKVADKIIANANLTLSACKLVADHGEQFIKRLPMIEGQPDQKPYEDVGPKVK